MSEDDAVLARYSQELVRAVESALGEWIDNSVQAVLHAQGRSIDAATAMLIATARSDATQAVIGELDAVLSLDVDEQRQNPLSILRAAVRYPTQVLRAVGALPVARYEFDERSFPDDDFALTPAAFSDFGPAVHDAGITWGAAKAHVHLRRRREKQRGPSGPRQSGEPVTGAAAAREIVVFAPDLMDRSRISAALPQARFVTSVDQLSPVVRGSLVLVDLGRPGVLDIIPTLSAAVIGFASHVDDELIRAGRDAGCTEVLPRSRFFRRLPEFATDTGQTRSG